MPDRSRIPKAIAKFDSYINKTDKKLQEIAMGTTTNWQRLGLSMANADKWHNLRSFWHDELFRKYNDPALSTSIIKKQVKNFIQQFKKFANPQLNIMAASLNATEVDEAVFNFVIKRADPTRTSVPIQQTVTVAFKHHGSSDLAFVCSIGQGANRRSKASGSDSVQMAYMILDDNHTDASTAFPNADDPRMTREIFTKSRFTKHMGSGNLTKRVVVFMRWYHTRHPELAGPWTEVMILVIA
jgi:hypothetical protein